MVIYCQLLISAPKFYIKIKSLSIEKVRNSCTHGLPRRLWKELPKPVSLLSSINKVKLYARNATSVYWNHYSLKMRQKTMNSDSYKKAILTKNTVNTKKRMDIYTMKHTLNADKICAYWIKTTSTNFLTKSFRWFKWYSQ